MIQVAGGLEQHMQAFPLLVTTEEHDRGARRRPRGSAGETVHLDGVGHDLVVPTEGFGCGSSRLGTHGHTLIHTVEPTGGRPR